MANLSQERREKMLAFLESLKIQHSDDESLIAFGEIERELKSKKYGLVWEEHEEDVDVKMRTHIPVFTTDDNKEIHIDTTSESYNFLLEGDNLHSLRLLEKTHRGKIDVIYIDPPYNTGNKDFIYGDTYIDGIDGFRHSKWLSFMAERLRIAHSLLSSTGVIFISIDDNEQATLKLLCDEIFGEVNFAGNVIIKSNPRGSQSKKEIASLHEYVLVYTKNSEQAKIIGHELSEEMQSEYKYCDENGKYRLLGLRQRGGFWRATERPNLFYPYYVDPVSESITLEEDETHSVAVYPYQPSTGEKGTWRWSREKFATDGKALIAKKVKRNGGIIWDIYQKDYIGTENVSRRTKAKSMWDEKEMNYQNAATELKEIFGTSPFTYAKPVYLIKRCLEMVDIPQNGFVLDFFAGSGTTGQAVLEQNKQDGGQRRFILCTNNENGICENVTYQRLKTVITGKRLDGSDYSEGIPSNLMYFRTDFVDKESEELSDELLAHIREMIQLEHGIKIDNRKYVVILSEEEMDAFEKNIANYPDLKAVFINSDIFLSAKQQKMLNNVDSYIIPDYYFDYELREAGEIW